MRGGKELVDELKLGGGKGGWVQYPMFPEFNICSVRTIVNLTDHLT